jgi:hypothetical protein
MIAEVAAMVDAKPPPAKPRPAPQFNNSPDSGRPPVEQFPPPIPAPSSRPDTTAPLGLRRGSPRAGQVVINPRHQLLLISINSGASRAHPTEVLALANGSSGAVCMACVDGIPSDLDLRGVL